MLQCGLAGVDARETSEDDRSGKEVAMWPRSEATREQRGLCMRPRKGQPAELVKESPPGGSTSHSRARAEGHLDLLGAG